MKRKPKELYKQKGEEYEYEYLEKKFGRNELLNNKNNNQNYLKSNEFESEYDEYDKSSCKTNSSLNNNELDCSLKMIIQQQHNDNTMNNNNVFVENIFSSHSLINKIDKQSDSDFTTSNEKNENSIIKEKKKNNGDVILGNKDLNNNKFESSSSSNSNSSNNTVLLNDKSTNISNISTPSNNNNHNNSNINNNNNSHLRKKEEDLYSLPTTTSLSSSFLINLKQKNNEIEDILEEERKSSVVDSDSDSKKTTIQIHTTHYENNNNHNEMIASNSQPNTQTNKKKLKNEEDANQITNNNNINIPTYNNTNNNGCSISNSNNHDDGVEILKDKCSDDIMMMNIENNNNNNNKDEVEGNKEGSSRIGDNESLSSSSVSTNSSFNLNDNSTDEYNNNLNQEFLGGNKENTTKKSNHPTSISCISAQSSNESGSNIKKVVLKNNEIVLIEDCTDDDDEDYLRLEKSKSQESAEIIPLSSSTENVMSRSYYSKPSQKSKKPIYNEQVENLSNNSEDPYVKAALERFDAFCKSKSTQNLDQNPTMTSPLLVNRQKSPYLSRKSANKPTEEQMNIGSFIKKRQARIDPKSQLSRNDSFEETNTKPTNSNRSISETRTESSQFRSLSSDKTRINKQIKPIDRSNEATTAQLTSSLAKKFLGSLTPQLEPVQVNDVHLEEPFELIQPKQRDEKPNIDCEESKTEKKKLTSSKTIDLARTKPQSPPSEPPKKNITLSSSTSSTISSVSSSASSDNSATSSPTHKANKPVNIIKLEVYNSKKQAKPNEQNRVESGSNISKPPLPPTPTVNTNVSTATNPSSWRSKLRSIYSEAPIIDGSQKATNVTTQQPSNETTTATVTKVNSNKPISRVIPLEIKNKSTSNQQTNTTKQTSTSNTITRGSSLYSSLKNIEKPTNTSSLPSNRSQSPPPAPSINTAQPHANFTSSVQDRIRSLSISYRDENERANRIRDEYAKFNVEVNDASALDNTHDPIAEKACSNFMHKLKEFQRQQSFQVYAPLSTTTATSPITTVPTVPTVSSYTGPIVSARTANTSPYIASSFAANSVYSPISTTYQPPSTYSSYASSKYSTIGPSTVNSYLSSSNDSSELSTSGSLTHRPYVSAIRKRRTLFSDELMSDESSNSSFSKTSSIFSHDSTTFQDPPETTIRPKIDNSRPNLDDTQSNNNKNGIGYSHARNRPLSIVNEEAAAAAAAAAANGGLNRSLTFNESHLLKSSYQTSRENTIRENEPISNQTTPKPKIQIKKSNSVNSPNSKPEINKARTKLSSSEKDQTMSSSTFNVAASNVTKPNNITPTKVNSSPQKPDTKKSTSFEQPNISNIKLQNEIAIVTSMVPKKKDIPIPIPTTNSDDNDACLNGQSINRIRSLDSKSREKYKSCIPNSNSNSNSAVKKQQSSPNSSSNTTTTTNSIPITPIIQTNLIPSCYLYPKSSSTSSDNSNSNNGSNSSKSSLSIGSEINTENVQNSEKGTVRRKSQVFLANGKLSNTAESGNKADVFERLSKRTNSMKNLSNSQIKPNSKSIGNSSDNEKTFSSNDEASTSQEYGLPQHNNHHNTSNSTANNLSKTSVFERLYKSNIAAHMNNHQNEINNHTAVEKNSLKKNMSVSSANLVSAVANQNINTTNSYISKNKTNGINLTKQRAKIGKISDEADDNNSLENFEKCEKDNTTNEEIDSNLIKKDPNFIKPSSSFLSHKLMDLFNK